MFITMRPVTKADLPQLQKISRATFSATFGAENTPADLNTYLATTYNQARLAQELANPATDFQFIFYQKQLAGYLKLNTGTAQTEPMGPASLEIERIYLSQAFKRLGLGTKLVQYALHRASQQHKQTVWLGVWEHNLPARQFYQRLGFQRFGAHQFQLGADLQHDLLLKKTLPA